MTNEHLRGLSWSPGLREPLAQPLTSRTGSVARGTDGRTGSQVCSLGLQASSPPGQALELRDASLCPWATRSGESAQPHAAGSEGGPGPGAATAAVPCPPGLSRLGRGTCPQPQSASGRAEAGARPAWGVGVRGGRLPALPLSPALSSAARALPTSRHRPLPPSGEAWCFPKPAGTVPPVP